MLTEAQRVPTQWGHLVGAYHTLLQAAYHDPTRPVRYMFLSESCVPWADPQRFYDVLTADPSVTYMDAPPARRTDNADRYTPHATALARAGVTREAFFKHSGWFALCRADAECLLRHPAALRALNTVTAGDEHILSVLRRPACGGGRSLVHRPVTYVDWSERDEALRRYTPDRPGFWDAVDQETDPARKATMLADIERWKSATMHPKTFARVTARDRAAFQRSGCLVVRKVGRGVVV